MQVPGRRPFEMHSWLRMKSAKFSGDFRPTRFPFCIIHSALCIGMSPHADQFGMSTGRAGLTCLLNSGLPERGVWCESTASRHSCARSSKRAGGLIPRIALDQCRVPERYRTRVPIPQWSSGAMEWCSVVQSASRRLPNVPVLQHSITPFLSPRFLWS